MHLLRLLLLSVTCLALVTFASADDSPSSAKPAADAKMVDLEFILIETDPSRQIEEKPPLWDSSLSAEKLRELALTPDHAERGVVSRVRLSAMENAPASVQVGQQKSVVVGLTSASSSRSRPRSVYNQRDMGTVVQATVRVQDDKVIVEYQIEKSRQMQPDVASVEELNAAPSGLATTTASSTVEVPNGRTILIGGMVTTSHEGVSRVIALLTANIVAPQESAE